MSKGELWNNAGIPREETFLPKSERKRPGACSQKERVSTKEPV